MKPNEMSVRDFMAMHFALAEINYFDQGIPDRHKQEVIIKSSYELADLMLQYGKNTEPKEFEHSKYKEVNYKEKVLEKYPDAKAVLLEDGQYGIKIDEYSDNFLGFGDLKEFAWDDAYSRIYNVYKRK